MKDIWAAFEEGARSSLGVAVACACAGLIIGSVTLTGIGLKLANGIVLLAGGYLLPTMFYTMIASLILGMGLPTTAKYIILASMAAPAIVKFGVPVMAAHMFIFYYGIIADLTPPVALAAYAGAGIAGADPMKTGFQALKLAVAGFLIPYIFVYNPQLLMINTTFANVIIPSLTAIIGAVMLAIAVAGYWKIPLYLPERFVMFVGALMLIWPGTLTDLCGLGLGVAVFFYQRYLIKKYGKDYRKTADAIARSKEMERELSELEKSKIAEAPMENAAIAKKAPVVSEEAVTKEAPAGESQTPTETNQTPKEPLSAQKKAVIAAIAAAVIVVLGLAAWINGKVSPLQTQVSQMQTRVGEIEKSLAGVDKSVKAVNGSVARLEKSGSEIALHGQVGERLDHVRYEMVKSELEHMKKMVGELGAILGDPGSKPVSAPVKPAAKK